MGQLRSLLTLLSLFLGFTIINSTEFVPVYMWSSARANAKVPGLHKISEDSFRDGMLDWLNKDKAFILVFSEETLSPEDFAQYDRTGGILYSNLAKLKQSQKVSYLPYVQNPIGALKHLNADIQEMPVEKLINENFNIPETDILIINLIDAKDFEDRLDMLKRHDTVVSRIYEKVLQSRKNVLALYTAQHTSWVGSENVYQSRKIRAVSDGTEDSGHFHSTKNAYLYYSKAEYVDNTKPEKKREQLTFANFQSEVTNDSAKLQLSLTDPKNAKLEVTLNFNNSKGYYELVEPVELKIDTATQSLTSTSDMYAPNYFSYHCGDQLFSNGNYSLFFKDFQVELFFGPLPNNTKFSDAYDCVGFTSVPIWSGLFVTSILLFIMTFGITMMMDIRTMDRFDDAKGKTITINAE
ncbi:unnamed protein product [Acanthoscelides obtectus]|uniref:V-type proton ATPase subunit S1 n=1 Tax=Acanthoscelides obtectus TaxID=200917 RepID=A0A9P0P4I6_ACAOB|nr:unnamed protein product [Acanthoscelides obtectus]CAK1629131.1 V-type proton ATPase subunit S1 [Acanthoscelides obtectus]